MSVVVRGKLISSFRTKFCATRWTVRATCFQRVIDNYNTLLKLWNDCLETRIESDVRGRIIGCQTKMKKFDFFFGLNLSQRIFSHTDNLSETLQKAGMSATSGQHNANVTKDALKKIRNDDCFSFIAYPQGKNRWNSASRCSKWICPAKWKPFSQLW